MFDDLAMFRTPDLEDRLGRRGQRRESSSLEGNVKQFSLTVKACRGQDVVSPQATGQPHVQGSLGKLVSWTLATTEAEGS